MCHIVLKMSRLEPYLTIHSLTLLNKQLCNAGLHTHSIDFYSLLTSVRSFVRTVSVCQLLSSFSICLPIKKTVNGSVIVLNFKYMYPLIRSIKWGFVWWPFPLKTIPSLTDYCFMSYSPDALTFTSDSGSGIDGNLQCTGNEVDIAQCPGFQQQEITCNEHIEINCSTWFYLCKVSIVFMYRIGQF